jgi:transcription-repair coupling factor (superfamily II helicase)
MGLKNVFVPSGAADSYWLSHQLAQSPGPLVVFTAAAWDAIRLKEELLWWDPDLNVDILPDWETLPYDHFSPHPDLISERLATLWSLYQGQCRILLVPVITALYPTPPVSELIRCAFVLKRQEKVQLDIFRNRLVQAGYQLVQQVLAPGEFCVRGGIWDVFPTGSLVPFRIEWMDDEVESLRTFDVDTQRTLYPVNEIRILPGREYPMDEKSQVRFRQKFRETFEGDPSRCRFYKEVGQGIYPGGIEYYLPLFYEERASLFDYLATDFTVVLHGSVDKTLEEFWQTTKQRYTQRSGDLTLPVLPPQDFFLTPDAFFKHLKSWSILRLSVRTEGAYSELFRTRPKVTISRRGEQPFKLFSEWLATLSGRLLIVAESLGRRETLVQMLREIGCGFQVVESWSEFCRGSVPYGIAVAALQQGVVLAHPAVTLLTESDLYDIPPRQQRREKATAQQVDSLIKSLSEIRVGDPVVHQNHGIGRFMGLVTFENEEGLPAEYLHVQYAKEQALYIPVAQLHVISRYSGGPPDQAPLHQLGSDQWEKAKTKAAKQARDTAVELLDLYAKRAARMGVSFEIEQKDYDKFCLGFEFEETADQKAAIEAVIADMRAPRPMDRLVCGDVGFGKTEVAMRAAFCAIQAGYQVALLVPTTLLAEQHFQNFSDRFSDWPVTVHELSRFRSAKESKKTLDEIASGQADLVIGTHKLIRSDVHFARLGLVIIDEEHRFGVRQKEQFKKIRTDVDVLALTATPIPRTLALSLEGIRDFSVIATAPQKRLAIKTFVYPYSDEVIREATLRELKRGGQIYFLYNEVETMSNIHDHLVKLVPEARIGIAHGQLSERELERVMHEFYHQRINFLLCSTIIETGIDVPTANTIVIHRSDRFGLAQLHQLRGRVGRSHHQAYAYLLTPSFESLTVNAKRRLEAIQRMEELGAGFYLAMQDMEIRGAGEILGDSQSGDVQEVGFGLYHDLLNHAIKALKNGEPWSGEDPMAVQSEVHLHAPTLLPPDYCPDIQERLVLYKRLSNATTEEQLQELEEELWDRFGEPPAPARLLIRVHNIRLLTEFLGIQKVDASEVYWVIHFSKRTKIEPHLLMDWVLAQHKKARWIGNDRLRLEQQIPEALSRVEGLRGVLKIFCGFMG